GYLRHTLGDFDAAIVDFTEALKIDPENILALSNRANARSKRGLHDAALEDMDLAIGLDPADPTFYLNRRVIPGPTAAPPKAAADFGAPSGINPKLAAAWRNRGGAHHQLKQYDEARRDYEEARRLEPDNVTLIPEKYRATP